MSENQKGLSGKSRAILDYIARGHSYEQILDTYPDFTYVDIFGAAREALDVIDSSLDQGTDKRQPDYLDEIRKAHPRAYEKWSDAEDAHLMELFQSGMNVKQIASNLQRQSSAIRSRLNKLGLIK